MNWNLKLIYSSIDEYNKDFESLDGMANELESYKGKLNDKECFKAYLNLYKELNIKVEKLYVYAHLGHDQNQKDLENGRLLAMIAQKYAGIATRLSFAEPEFLAIGYDTIKSFLKDGLEEYSFFFESLFRQQEHVLSAKEEAMISNFNDAGRVYNSLYDKLTIVDGHDEEVTLSTGEKISVSVSNFTYYLGILDNPADRTLVFEAVYKYLFDHKTTLAAIYEGIMKMEYANAKERGYKSCLEAKLDRENIPLEVYTSLMNTARENTAPLKRYYALRKKYFKLDQVRTYDRFLKFRKSEKNYSYAEAKELVLKALETMGPDFVKRAEFCLSEGRVDVEIKDGKRNGAYSSGTYTNGPFILLNHNGNLNDAFTIAHECGHSIHTTYANDTQDYFNANYSIFVAEVASTFNEARFLDYLMEVETDKNEKIVLLQQAIDNICSTFYRQTLFATYEYEAHKLLEEGTPIDSDALSNIMKQLYKDYYDIDLNNERYKEMVYAYIPHFYHTPFYVFQYATSFSASQSIYLDVKNKKPNAFDKYINLLKSGGSDYPVKLLQNAGCDLTKPEPFKAVVTRMNELLDALEALLEN